MSSADHTIDVLYLTHNYPRHAGDFAGRFVARLAELVSSTYGSVGVLAPHHPGAALEETVSGVQVQRFRYGHDVQETVAYRGDLGKVRIAGPQGVGAHARFLRSFSRAAATLVAQYSPRVVHAHWWIPAGWIARGLNFTGRLLVTLHGTDARLLQTRRWLRPLAARVLDRAAVISVVSTWLADSLGEVFPRFRNKFRVIPMPPDDDVFRRCEVSTTPREEPVIVSVTRFTQQKRNAVLLHALDKLRSEGVAFRARLIGDGPLRQELNNLAAQLELGAVVEFRKPIPQPDLADEYRRADVVVLPAVGEGFGMALVEAQLCGTAVVGAKSGGLTDIIEDGRSGLLAKPDDAADLAAALRRVLSDRTLRSELAAAGHASAVSKFSSAAIVKKFCQCYGER